MTSGEIFGGTTGSEAADELEGGEVTGAAAVTTGTRVTTSDKLTEVSATGNIFQVLDLAALAVTLSTETSGLLSCKDGFSGEVRL